MIIRMNRLHISQIDTFFASGIYPIEFLFYFKNSVKTNRIRAALKKIAATFWPLFGTYDAGIIRFNGYDEAACFEEEVCKEAFNIDASHDEIYQTYAHAVPTRLKKLFFLKIMQYNNGTVLLPKLNHLGGDGYSYFYFLSLLAAISQRSYIPFKKGIMRHAFKPDHNRTILRHFQLKDIPVAPFREQGSLRIQFEKVNRDSVHARVKAIAADSGHSVSTNDVLSAMILKKSAERQKELFGETVQLTIPVDVRRKIKEYGPKFFGNSLQFNLISFRKTDIMQMDSQKIAVRIRQAMPAVSKKDYLDYLAAIEEMISKKQTEKLRPYDPDRGCLVTNLSKMPVNRLNFGSGNPDLVFPLTIAKNSAAILADPNNFILRLAY
jgi:NRPS condensation-like uncharacterized protein